MEEWEKHMARHKQTHGLHTIQTKVFCMNFVGRHKDAPIECSFAHFVTSREALPGNVLTIASYKQLGKVRNFIFDCSNDNKS